MSREAAAGSCSGRESQDWNERQLAQSVSAPRWRLWRYERPIILVGRSQRRVWPERSSRDGIGVFARASGGGAVLAGPWLLGLSVALPAGHPLAGTGPVEGYRWLGETLAAVLMGLGVCVARALSPAELRRVPFGRPDSLAWACFGGLSAWEVVAGGRKIAGLAQVRRREGVLLVAGVLLSPPPWAQLCRGLGQAQSDAIRLRERTTSLEEEAPAPIAQRTVEARVARAVRASLRTARAAPESAGSAPVPTPEARVGANN